MSSYCQNPNSVYSSTKPSVRLALPNSRTIKGGTVFLIEYDGSGYSKDSEGAFEYACKIIEEKIPTTFPIRVKAQFGNLGSNELARVEVGNTPDDLNLTFYPVDKVYAKRYAQINYGRLNLSDSSGFAFFRDGVDITITFSSNQPFCYDYKSENISSRQYDFVTVALQALIKGIGFTCEAIKYDEPQLYMSDHPNKYTQMILTGDSIQNFRYATSGNASIPSCSSNYRWMLECGSDYQQGISLNYLSENNTEECSIMQYGIPKGAYIRDLGWFLDDFCSFCEWDRLVATGSQGTNFNYDSTDDVIGFQGISTSSNAYINNGPLVQRTSYSFEDSFAWYMQQRAEIGDIGSYVLLKDGSWRMFSDLRELTDSDEYARNPDGHVRIKEIGRAYGPGGGYSNTVINYRLYDYIPQKPVAAFSKYSVMDFFRNFSIPNANRSRQTLSSDDIYVEAEIDFKNTEGTQYILVEQTDSDYPYPYTYYVDDVTSGSFTTYMNMRYPSTFRLTYINSNGQVTGEPFTVDLTDNIGTSTNSRAVINCHGNTVSYSVAGSHDQPLSYRITNVSTGEIVTKNSLHDMMGIIDTSRLPRGLYSICISSSGKVMAELKWMKE